jgi:hypothetical protein
VGSSPEARMHGTFRPKCIGSQIETTHEEMSRWIRTSGKLCGLEFASTFADDFFEVTPLPPNPDVSVDFSYHGDDNPPICMLINAKFFKKMYDLCKNLVLVGDSYKITKCNISFVYQSILAKLKL